MSKKLAKPKATLSLEKRTLRALTLSDTELGQLAGASYSRTRPTTNQFGAPTVTCHG